MKNKKIIIHYPFVANYRIPVFNEIAKSDSIDLVVLSATESKDKTLLSKNNGWEFKHIETKLMSFSIFNKEVNFEFNVLVNLIKMRRKYDYYVILSNPNIISSWLYSLFAKIIGYKVIFWGHGLLKKEQGLKSFIRKLYYKIPYKFWLYGNSAKKLMIDDKIDSHKLSVIYNSLDYNKQKELRDIKINHKKEIKEKFGFKDNDFVFICIGRLLPKLEIERLINIFPKLKALNISPKLLIIGDGPSKNELIDLVDKHQLAMDVVFTGAIYDEEILSNYYVISDLSVVMGIVGLAAMHSLAYGVPMITHSSLSEHCPEIEAIIEGETGYFFDKQSDESFLNKIIQVIRNKEDLSDNCISRIESYYTPKKQVEYIIESLNGK
ncbi:TPA: glycosyltransferase family 4 protein [Photobacterium damselae]